MLGQLPWNLSENAPHAAGIAIGELADIITVQLQDATLDQIHLAKIALLDIIGNRLRHTAHQQIFAPQPHRSFVQRIGQRDQTLERFANRFSKQLLPHGPAELLKIERPHVHFPFLGGDDDIRHIPLDGDQRTSFHIVIPAIRNQIFDELPRRRIPLHLVENNQRFTLVQSLAVIRRQQHEKCVKVITLVFEDVANVARQTCEIDENI